MSNVLTVEQTWNHVVMEQGMRSLPIGKKYSCEEEWWHSTTISQKQKENGDHTCLINYLRSHVL